jgi:hypothetical protein
MKDSSMFIVEPMGGNTMAVYMRDTGQRVCMYQISNEATYLESAMLASELMQAFEKYLRNIMKNRGRM